MTWRQRLRRGLRRFGVDVVRYPLHDPMARTVKLLAHYGVATVVDIGANNGGFAREIRGLGYSGRIISFEPLARQFAALESHARKDLHWEVHKLALGANEGEVQINVAGNDGQSSSVLPMLAEHAAIAPESAYVRTETVPLRRLDDMLPELRVTPQQPAFLKVDVQGYEGTVLDGAEQSLRSGAIAGLSLELSLTALYEGAMTYREGLDRAEAHGFRLMGLDGVFADPKTGRLLQVDAVFFPGSANAD